MRTYIIPGVIILAGLIIAGAFFWFNTRGQEKNMSEIFLDVRTPQEWEQGHIAGAVLFDLARLQAGELPDLSKDIPIAIYCRSGARAGQALQILQQKGYMHLRNAGGLAGLQQQGMKICIGSDPLCD